MIGAQWIEIVGKAARGRNDPGKSIHQFDGITRNGTFAQGRVEAVPLVNRRLPVWAVAAKVIGILAYLAKQQMTRVHIG